MIKSNSSAALYYKDVGNFELLSKDEELKLGEQVKQGGEQAGSAVNKLVESNLRLVVKIAQDFQGRGQLPIRKLVQK